jgi:hypothetical protein
MKYALLIYSPPADPDTSGYDTGEHREPSGEGGLTWLEYTRAVREAGVLVAVEQLTAVDSATSVSVRGGERLLTDGPFAETKEHLLGFYLLDLPDLDTALDWAARMPSAGYGTIEVRPVRTGMAWQAALA